MNFGDITLARSPQLRTTAAVHVPALRVILEKFLETTGGHDGTPSQRGLFQGSGRALDCLWCKENRIGFGRPVLHPKRSALPISKTVTKIVTRLCPNMPQSDQKAGRPEIPALNPPRTRLLPPKLHKTGTVTGIFSVHPAAARSSILNSKTSQSVIFGGKPQLNRYDSSFIVHSPSQPRQPSHSSSGPLARSATGSRQHRPASGFRSRR